MQTAFPSLAPLDVKEPPQPRGLNMQLSQLLRRSHHELTKLDCEDEETLARASDIDKVPVTTIPLQPLPKTSPYVGFRRHAPPSPTLNFTVLPNFSLDAEQLESQDDTPRHVAALPGNIPLEVWENLLSWAIEVPGLAKLLAVSYNFRELVRSPTAWAGQAVIIMPEALQDFTPQLHTWLPSWKHLGRLVVPNSVQLLAEVSRCSPEIPLEVAWRFDSHLKGQGVEVINGGRTVRRIADEGLVVLGDAPLSTPYLEVILDSRRDEEECEEEAEQLNDFGLGVTICSPEDMSEDDIEEADVADEVPHSWVVDFARSFANLSVDNREVARTNLVSAQRFSQGDRVGIRIMPDGFQVFINGAFIAKLTPEAGINMPSGGVALYPVLDLYGQSLQISRSYAGGPQQ